MAQRVDIGAKWRAWRVPASLPNDTEESIVGTEWHQEAIGALAAMLRDVADRRGATWGVCEQVALAGLRYPDGHPYDPRPDVMVLERDIDGSRASVPLAEVGAPLFIAEAASDSTSGNDVGNKRLVYEAVGVPEYIVFDPTGNVLPAATPLRAWRLEAGSYVPWYADADGWWRSASLGVAFRDTQPFLGVRDRDGAEILPDRALRRRARRIESQIGAVEGERDSAVRERDSAVRERDSLAERLAEEAQRRAELEKQLRRLREGRDEP